MLAVVVSARAFTTDPRIEVTLYPRLRTSPLPVAGDARWSSRPMTEHRVMSEVLLYITHYRSRRCYESQPFEEAASLRRGSLPSKKINGLTGGEKIPGLWCNLFSWSCPGVIEREGNGPQSDGKSAPDGAVFDAAHTSGTNELALRRRDFVTPPKPGETGRSMTPGHDPRLVLVDCSRLGVVQNRRLSGLNSRPFAP